MTRTVALGFASVAAVGFVVFLDSGGSPPASNGVEESVEPKHADQAPSSAYEESEPAASRSPNDNLTSTNQKPAGGVSSVE